DGLAPISPAAVASGRSPARGAGGLLSETAKTRLRPSRFARYNAESAAAIMSVRGRPVAVVRVATPVGTVTGAGTVSGAPGASTLIGALAKDRRRRSAIR